MLESDVEDYPGMFVQANGPATPGLHGDFARYPAREALGGFHNMQLVVPERANFIAQTSGTPTCFARPPNRRWRRSSLSIS